MSKWYEMINYEQAKNFIAKNIKDITRSFVSIGYYLKYIQAKELYKKDGYQDIWEFAFDTYGISRSTASRYIAINDRFSDHGNSPILAMDYQDYSKSKLQEMLYLTDEQIEKVEPKMTVKEIREIRKPKEIQESQKPKECITGKSGSGECATSHKEKNIVANKTIIAEPCITAKQDSQFRDIRKSESEFDHYIYGYKEVFSDTEKEMHMDYLMMIPRMCDEGRQWLVNRINELHGNNCKAVEEWAENFLPVLGSMCAKMFDGKGIVIRYEYGNTFAVYTLYQFMDLFKKLYMQEQETKPQEEQITEPCSTAKQDSQFCEEVSSEYLEECAISHKEIIPAAEVEGQIKISDYEGIIPEGMTIICQEHEEEVIPQNVLKEEAKKLNDWLSAFEGEELPAFVRKQKIIVEALNKTIITEPEQPEFPILKNNEQRKEWLNNYKEWGLWYEDSNIGARYYKYDFENGARLIAETYKSRNEYSGTEFESCHFHLVGGPEPPKSSCGCGRWTRHEEYNRYADSITELIEFLKMVQKGE